VVATEAKEVGEIKDLILSISLRKEAIRNRESIEMIESKEHQ